jgi:hypothetical protein
VAVSNQQPGWQQPQYGGGHPPQYGGYPPPQYGGYPPPYGGYPPPRKSRTGLVVVLSVVGGLVLFACALVVIAHVTAQDEPVGSPAAPVATGWSPPASAKPSVPGVSGVKVQTVLTAVKAAGFTCKDNGFEWECTKPLNYITVTYDHRDATIVADYEVQTFSGRGPNGMPGGPRKVVVSAKQYLTLGIPLLFADPTARAQVTAWFAHNLGTCPVRGSVPVAGYYLSCDPPSAITVTEKIPMTSWDNVARIEHTRLR